MKMLEELKKMNLEKIEEGMLNYDNHELLKFSTDTLTGITNVAHCCCDLESYQNGDHDVIDWRSTRDIDDMDDLNRIFDCYSEYTVVLVDDVAYVYDNSKKEFIGWC